MGFVEHQNGAMDRIFTAEEFQLHTDDIDRYVMDVTEKDKSDGRYVETRRGYIAEMVAKEYLGVKPYIRYMNGEGDGGIDGWVMSDKAINVKSGAGGWTLNVKSGANGWTLNTGSFGECDPDLVLNDINIIVWDMNYDKAEKAFPERHNDERKGRTFRIGGWISKDDGKRVGVRHKWSDQYGIQWRIDVRHLRHICELRDRFFLTDDQETYEWEKLYLSAVHNGHNGSQCTEIADEGILALRDRLS